MLLPLSAGGVLQDMGKAGLTFPSIAFILLPFVVGIIFYVLFPVLMIVTCGWAARPDCPRTRAEPCRFLEDGCCPCRVPRVPPTAHAAAYSAAKTHNTIQQVHTALRAIEADVVAVAMATEASAGLLPRAGAGARTGDAGQAVSRRSTAIVAAPSAQGTAVQAGDDDDDAANPTVSTADVSANGSHDLALKGAGGTPAASVLASRDIDTEGGCPVVDDSLFRPALVLHIAGPACGCVAEAVAAAGASGDAEEAVYEMEVLAPEDGKSAVIAVRARCVAALTKWRSSRLAAVEEAAANAGAEVTARLRVDASSALLHDAAAHALPVAWPSPAGPPHVYKLVVATFLGLYPSLVLAGSPASATVAQAGASPVLVTLTAVLTAVPMVVFLAAPLMALIMQQWMRDENSGEFAWLPRRARFCVERGCITRERLPPLEEE